MMELIHITDKEFEQQVLQAQEMAVVFFSAPWKGACRYISPTLVDIAAELADQVVIAEINIDDDSVWHSRLDAPSVPALVFFKDGKEVNRFEGALTENQFKSLFTDTLAS